MLALSQWKWIWPEAGLNLGFLENKVYNCFLTDPTTSNNFELLF